MTRRKNKELVTGLTRKKAAVGNDRQQINRGKRRLGWCKLHSRSDRKIQGSDALVLAAWPVALVLVALGIHSTAAIGRFGFRERDSSAKKKRSKNRKGESQGHERGELARISPHGKSLLG